MKRTLLLSFFVLFLAAPSLTFAVTLSSMTASEEKALVYADSEVTPSAPAVTSVSDAFKEFKNLSRKERRERIKEAKKEIKEFKQNKKSGSEPSTNTLLLVILAILIPPLAVYLHQGEINSKFWIDLLLTLLFFLPGVIYALIVILGNE